MKKTTVGKNYDTNLQDASYLLNSDPADLISLKIRPIDIFPETDDDEFWDAYMCPSEYEQVQRKIKGEIIRKGWVNSGEAFCYILGDDEFIFVKHETGAEIIVISCPLLSQGFLKLPQASWLVAR